MINPRKQTGFNLIELMIVVAIIGILGSVAIPQYRDYVRSTERTECSNEIDGIKVALEENFIAANTYPAGTVNGGGLNTLTPALGGLYQRSANLANCNIAVVPGNCVAGTCTSYTINIVGINQLADMAPIVINGP